MSKKCKDCLGRGQALTYTSGRVLMAYCHCSNGRKKEIDRDKLCASQGTDPHWDRKFRIRLKPSRL